MNKSRYWIPGMTAVAALVSVVLLAGCGDTPMTPVSGDRGIDALNYYESVAGGDDLSAGAGRWLLSSDADTACVGKAGGTISLNMGGAISTLKIPADAVCSSGGTCKVCITARSSAVQTPFGPLYVYDFGPDGLKFAKQCELKLNAGFVPGSLVSLYWLNPLTIQWEWQSTTKVLAHGEVKFYINHFSKYGIS